MAGLFIGFLVEKYAAFPSHRKSVFWWHRFQNEPLPNLAGCVGGLKSLRRFWPYLMAFLMACIREYWMSAICLAKKPILSEVCTINKEHLIVLFTSYVMYKKYKRLVYTPSDLSARFCKVNLSNTKNPAWFLILVSLLDRGERINWLSCLITGL